MKTSGRLALIDDYLSGGMSDDEAAPFESELFAAAAAGEAPDLAYIDELRHAASWLAQRAGFSGGVTREQAERLRATVPNTHYFEIAGELTEVDLWGSDVTLVVYRVGVDLRGLSDVDVSVSTPEGQELKTFHDVQYDPNDGAIYGVCEEPIAREAILVGPTVSRAYATRDGERALIAEWRVTPRQR